MWVQDGRKHFNGASIEDIRLGPMLRRATPCGVVVPPSSEVAKADALLARVNHNRWIVDCPDCNGAEFVWLDQLVMMCQSCWNSSVGGKWRRVRIPADVQQIEAALEKRHAPQNRNWEPGETVADLKADNRAHGLEE